MRLIVTRPEPDASRTAEDLRGLGHEPIMAPLMTATFRKAPAGWAKVRPAALLLTSANALRAIAAWPETRTLRDVPVFVVGDRTGDAARVSGFTAICSASGDADDLLELVRSTLRPGDGVILYPAAVDRTGDLDGRLARAGYDIKTLEAYEMIAATEFPDAVTIGLRSGDIDGALFYSRRTVEIFVRLIDQAGLRLQASALRLYALSARLAERLDFGTVTIAACPNDAALLALLQDTDADGTGSDGTGATSLR